MRVGKLKTFSMFDSLTTKKKKEMETCMSPVSERRTAMVSEEAYGWFSQSCVENTDCKPLVYETTDGGEVLALGVCSSPDLTSIMWKDKVCVGLVKTKTAKRSSMRGYMACSRSAWQNRTRAVVAA